jgi:ABC-type multidrug transport system fused ATPase/permease subunit
MMSIVPPIALAAIFYGKYVSKISKRTMEATAALTKLSEEKISQIRTVKAFAQEDKEEKFFKEKTESIYNFAIKDALASVRVKR